MLRVRRLIRRIVPFSLRWRLRLVRRRLSDDMRRTRFARTRQDARAFPVLICRYERPLICYPGQEHRFAGKQHNCTLVLRACDDLVIEPNETFSFWDCIGRPTQKRGFLPAAALKDGRLVEDIGGAVCLASTLLYNVGLLSGMAIVERRCHSVDSYGAARYFELGRDAAVEYAYLDLRLRNDFASPLLLRSRIEDDAVIAEIWSDRALGISVEIVVGVAVITPPTTVVVRDASLGRDDVVVADAGATGVRVHTSRMVRSPNGPERFDDLGISIHHSWPRRERRGAESSVRL